MKILVGIANYGTKNRRFLDRVLAEYRKMTRFAIDVVIFSEAPKEYGSDVEVVVGLPVRNPWSLPFAHKSYFADRARRYDLFIYTEDDTLIEERQIEAFLRVTKLLPKDHIAGFVRYETGSDGSRFYTTMHAHFHWDPNSVVRLGSHVFAHYRNEHSGCYILTQDQLRRAISSGGYLLPCRTERYGFPETAATDPYTQCGLRKVICISHFSEFCIPHLPNAYWHYMGLPESHVMAEIQSLLAEVSEETVTGPLFRPDTLLAGPAWDKQYYEECREDIVRAVPENTRTLLSIGCGSGTTEAKLLGLGVEVTAIPMDRIVGATAGRRGIQVLPPAMDSALEVIDGRRFDCILLNEVICHIQDPVGLLAQLEDLLEEDGKVIVADLNGGGVRGLRHELIATLRRLCAGPLVLYQEIRYHLAGVALTRRWISMAGLRTEGVKCDIPRWWHTASRMTFGKLDHLVAKRFLLICGRARNRTPARFLMNGKYMPSNKMRAAIRRG